LIGEPLVHFVVLGVLIFAVYGLLPEAEDANQSRITVTAQDIERLRTLWERQWGRPPTQEELSGLVESHVREQVLYVEALKMGLDRDDTIVRRRMVQKMEFLSEGVTNTAEPPAEELDEFWRRNAARYAVPAKVSFSHVYFSRDRRGTRAEGDARAALSLLASSNGAEDPSRLGDPIMLQYDHRLRTQREVAEMFGAEFAEAVFQTEVARWRGPIESAYGLHLVRVSERTEPRTPPLAEVRERVVTDWRHERRQQANQSFYENLRQQYEIVIEDGALEHAGGGG
jgi:hypothetical protein